MFYNPCEDGHEFCWIASSTGEEKPPSYISCQCGAYTYQEYEDANSVSDKNSDINQVYYS